MIPVSTLAGRVARVLAVLGLVALAGCTRLLPDSEPELPEAETAVQTYDSLDAYRIEESYTASGTDDTGPITMDTKRIVRPGTGQEYEKLANESGTQTLRVSNGTVQWIYLPERQTVTRAAAPERSERTTAFVVDLVAAANDATDNGNSKLFPAFPGVGAAGDADATAVAPVGTFEAVAVSYEGTEAVAGRQTHMIAAERSGSPDALAGAGQRRVDQRIYLDTEWYVPLKVETETQIGDRTYHSEFVAERVSFDPDVDAERFEFEPPENATVVDAADRVETVDRRAALSEFVSDPPDPAVPDGFAFDRATVDGETGGVVLEYTDGETRLAVSRAPADEAPPPDGDPTEFDGRSGYYSEEPVPTVAWTCDGDRYRVVGELDREQLVSIAVSVSCS